MTVDNNGQQRVLPTLRWRWSVGVFVLHTLWVMVGATKGIQASDSSEFVLASIQNTRIHPPGYPLLSLWGHCFQWLSVNSMWNTAVAMGVLHSIALAVLVDTCWVLTKHRGLSLWVVAVLSMQPLWIRYSTIAEAFPALTLVYSVLLWLYVVPEQNWHSILFAVCLTVGLGTHHMFILAFPMMAILGWRYWTRWWQMVLGIVVGLSSYLWLWDSAESAWRWGEVQNLSDLLQYFLRRDYGTFQITHSTEVGTWWGTSLHYLKTLLIGSWGVFSIGIVGCVQISKTRHMLWCLVSWLLSSVVILALFGLPTTPVYLSHSNRFFVSSMVLWIPFVGLGGCWLLSKLNGLSRLVGVLSWGVPLGLAMQNYSVAGRFDQRMQRWIEDSCEIFPSDSLVFVAGDGQVFGSVLAQEGLGLCQQVQFVYPRLLGYQWYRERLGFLGIEGQSMLEILQQHNGPAFSVLGLVGDGNLPASVPFGGYWMQFIPPHQPMPTPTQVESHLSQLAEQIESTTVYHPFLLFETAESWPHEQWGHSWISLSTAYQANGQNESATSSQQYGMQWLPSKL